MSALILYCATSMLLHVGLPHRHAPDLIDMVMPVSHLILQEDATYITFGTTRLFRRILITDGVWFGDQLAVFRPNFVQNCEFRFFVQNAKFRDFVRFSSRTNFLCPYILVVSLFTSHLILKLTKADCYGFCLFY